MCFRSKSVARAFPTGRPVGLGLVQARVEHRLDQCRIVGIVLNDEDVGSGHGGLRPESGRDHPIAELYAQVDSHCSRGNHLPITHDHIPKIWSLL